MRGQAAIMDALMFMLIASGAATLLLYVSSIYGSSTNQQIIAMYNYEFSANALATLHYAKDSQGAFFWRQIKANLAEVDSEAKVSAYLGGAGSSVWTALKDASPSSCPFLCFTTPSGQTSFCYPASCQGPKGEALVEDPIFSARTAYSSSVNLKDTSGGSWAAVLKLFY